MEKNNEDSNVKNTRIKYIDFEENGIKILGIFFSYKKKLRDLNNIDRVVTNFKTVLSIWKSRSLTLIGKIQVLRTLALPKLYYVFSKMTVAKEIMLWDREQYERFYLEWKKTKD